MWPFFKKRSIFVKSKLFFTATLFITKCQFCKCMKFLSFVRQLLSVHLTSYALLMGSISLAITNWDLYRTKKKKHLRWAFYFISQFFMLFKNSISLESFSYKMQVHFYPYGWHPLMPEMWCGYCTSPNASTRTNNIAFCRIEMDFKELFE